MDYRKPSPSPSPSRRSFSNKISAISAKISRKLSNDSALAGGDRDESQRTLMGSEKGQLMFPGFFRDK